MTTQYSLTATEIGNIRHTLRYLREVADIRQSQGEEYRLDRLHAEEYFRVGEPREDIGRKLERAISEYTQDLKATGNHSLVFVDICGRATYGLAEHNYSFSLQPHNSIYPQKQGECCVVGNIFDSKDFRVLLNMLNKNSHRPFLVTFEPVAGLENYNPLYLYKEQNCADTTIYGCLEKRLAEIVEILLPGGYLFLGKPFQGMNLMDFFVHKIPQEEYVSSLWVKHLARKLKCSFRVVSCPTGPYWILRKYKNVK